MGYLERKGYEYNFKVNLDVSVSEFRSKMATEIESGPVDIFSGFLKNSNRKKCKYIGSIDLDSMKFKIKNVGREQNFEVISGFYKGDERETHISVKITAVHRFLKIWYFHLGNKAAMPKVKSELLTLFEGFETN